MAMVSKQANISSLARAHVRWLRRRLQVHEQALVDRTTTAMVHHCIDEKLPDWTNGYFKLGTRIHTFLDKI